MVYELKQGTILDALATPILKESRIKEIRFDGNNATISFPGTLETAARIESLLPHLKDLKIEVYDPKQTPQSPIPIFLFKDNQIFLFWDDPLSFYSGY